MKIKPAKPSPEFPLFPHDSGKWAKKIQGKLKYFGRWDDPEAALLLYQRFVSSEPPKDQRATESQSGVTGRVLSVRVSGELFLQAKHAQVSAGNMSNRTFLDYSRTINRAIAFFGAERPITSLGPADFEAYRSGYAKKNNPVSVGNEITRIKTMLKWLLATKRIKTAIDVGPDFRKPPARIARRHKRERGKLLFKPEQIRAIADESGLRMRAMILLGINCGYHNNDCESLSLELLREAVSTGWLDNARAKTEAERRCPLWPETIAAASAWIQARPASDDKAAFVLADGRPLSAVNTDVAKRFRASRDAALIGVGGFSWLRKTFATVAGASGDQVAVNFIMGHVDPSIPGVYRQEIQDERLEKVVAMVRHWLYPGPPPPLASSARA